VRPLTDILKTGQWKGRRCFVVGSGPSTKGFDFSHLKDELWIGCNEEYRHSPTIAICQDVRGFKGDGERKGYRDMPEWYAHPKSMPVYFKGHPDREDIEASDLIFQAKSCHSMKTPFSWATHLEDGLTYGANTGIAAVSLADVLGASPIYLLGFDFTTGPKGEQRSHDRYPASWGLENDAMKDIYKRWAAEFTKHAPSMRGKIIVVGPTTLMCFKRIAYSELMEELLK
jgi:hypothetical protein